MTNQAMQQSKGIVQNIKQRDKGYSLLLDDSNWYGGFGSAKNGEGDEVEIDWAFSEDGKYRNIKSIKTISTGNAEQIQQTLKEHGFKPGNETQSATRTAEQIILSTAYDAASRILQSTIAHTGLRSMEEVKKDLKQFAHEIAEDIRSGRI